MRTFPEGWCAVQLREVALVRGGTSFPPSSQGRVSGDLPFYKVSDMNLLGNEVEMSQSSNWIEEHDLQLLRAKTFPAKTTIFPKVGGALLTNKKRFLSREALVDNNVMGVVSRDPTRCLPEFLFSWFETVDLSALANAGPLPSINASQLYELSIPLPGSAEQRSIADVLHICRVSVNIERTAAVAAVELKQAAMREMFTRGMRGDAQKETEIGPIPERWSIVPIKDIATTTQYGLSTRGHPQGNVPLLRMNCQMNGKVHFRDLQYADLDADTVAAFRLRHGDLLFNRTNSIEHVGRTAIFEGEREAVFASYLVRLSVDQERCLPSFLNYYLNRVDVQREIKRYASRAVGQANINATKLREIAFPLPPSLEEQREIVSILEAVDQKIALHQEKCSVLEELFQSLLHKLMTGEIRVSELDLSALSTEVAG
jgi:type I restriction enzyme S subunit